MRVGSAVTEDAAFDVASDHFCPGLVEGRTGSGELRENVIAVLSTLHHAAESPDLALDSCEAAVDGLSRCGVHISIYPIGYQKVSRKIKNSMNSLSPPEMGYELRLAS